MQKHNRLLLQHHAMGLAVAMLLMLIASFSLATQSTDRDRPTPLRSNELRGELDGSDTEYFFSFIAGPGELTVTFDVKASGTNAGANLDLLDKNSRQLITLLAQGVDRGSERKAGSVRLGSRQTVIIRLKGISYGSSGGQGTYLVRLGGAVQLGQAEQAVGSRSGKLRIEMNDGSIQEIELSRVRRVTVEP